MRKEFIVNIARYYDLHRIITFLSQPDIDKGFRKPLSERNISISERVYLKYNQGIWVLAEIENQIVSCLATVPNGKGVSFSTGACIKNIECIRAGGGVWEKSLELARNNVDVPFVEIDSWEGNVSVSRVLRKRGFKKIRTYPDPEKRPEGVKSVLYRMTLR